MGAVVFEVPGTAGDPTRPYTYGIPNFGGRLYAAHVLGSDFHTDGSTAPLVDLSGNDRDLDIYAPSPGAGIGLQDDGFYGSTTAWLLPPGNSRALYASGTAGEMTRVHFGLWPVSSGYVSYHFTDLDIGNPAAMGDYWFVQHNVDGVFDTKINAAAATQEATLALSAYRDEAIMLAVRASPTSFKLSRGHAGGLSHGAAVARAFDANPTIAGNPVDGSGRIGQASGTTPLARLSAVLVYDIALTDEQLREVLTWGASLGLAD